MNKIAVLFSIVVGFSTFAVVAQEKETGKSGAKATVSAEHKIYAAADLQWVDGAPGLPAGAKMAVLDGDPTKKGSFTVRLQAPAGYKVPPHTHPSAEHITVISGTLHLGMGAKFDETAGRELAPGGFGVMPAGMQHFAWSTTDTIIQIQSEGPFEIKYVNPADDPRTAKK